MKPSSQVTHVHANENCFKPRTSIDLPFLHASKAAISASHRERVLIDAIDCLRRETPRTPAEFACYADAFADLPLAYLDHLMATDQAAVLSR